MKSMNRPRAISLKRRRMKVIKQGMQSLPPSFLPCAFVPRPRSPPLPRTIFVKCAPHQAAASLHPFRCKVWTWACASYGLLTTEASSPSSKVRDQSLLLPTYTVPMSPYSQFIPMLLFIHEYLWLHPMPLRSPIVLSNEPLQGRVWVV